MTSIAVYCGSSSGSHPEYIEAAKHAGSYLARHGYDLVYGGGSAGLMGAVADAAVQHGGRVTGVTLQTLVDREIAHKGLTEMRVVSTMHERKATMASLADAFLALPGGSGTLDEIGEQWTWAQLGLHEKPCGFLNVRDFYTPLRQFIARMVDEGFTKPQFADMLIFESDLAPLLERFENYPATKQRGKREATGSSAPLRDG